MSKDLTQNLNGSLEDKVDRLIIAVQSMDSRLEKVEIRLDNFEVRLERLETRLTSLETKVDERLKDTRPIWEAVQAQLSALRESISADILGLRSEMENGFRRLDRAFDHLAGDVTRLHGDHRVLEERVDKVERRLSQ